MKIRLLCFASVREALGVNAMSLDVPVGLRAEGLFACLWTDADEAERWRAATQVAVNARHVAPTTELHDGDEVALIPPVAGG